MPTHADLAPPDFLLLAGHPLRWRLLRELAARYFGLKRFGAIFGVLGLFFGLSVAIGGIGAGFLFDAAGDYRLVLILGAAQAAVSAVSLLASGFAKGRPVKPAPALNLEPATT